MAATTYVLLTVCPPHSCLPAPSPPPPLPTHARPPLPGSARLGAHAPGAASADGGGGGVLGPGGENELQLGNHPVSGEPVAVRLGPYGLYVQQGVAPADKKDKKAPKPRRAAVPKVRRLRSSCAPGCFRVAFYVSSPYARAGRQAPAGRCRAQGCGPTAPCGALAGYGSDSTLRTKAAGEPATCSPSPPPQPFLLSPHPQPPLTTTHPPTHACTHECTGRVHIHTLGPSQLVRPHPTLPPPRASPCRA